VAVILGLLVAATYGAGDFLGGISTKRAPVAVVVVLSQLSGLPVLAVLVVLFGGDPTTKTFLLGAAAGVVGGLGLSCLYRGLASGRMSVVAPITGVGAAIVPVLWGLLQGERPGTVALFGVALALVAVTLISRSGAAVDHREASDAHDENEAGHPQQSLAPVLGLAVIAGAAFGTVFCLLAETGDGVGFWPLVAGRITSIVFLASANAISGRAFALPEPGALRLIAPAGVFDVSANALYLLAARQGLLALVAVLSSLYPVGTVLLARVVLKERLTRHQVGGLGLAALGVVCIAAG
jgi:drug/metabolite transporter (DMT)-like permease